MRAGFKYLRLSALAKFVTAEPSSAGHGENDLRKSHMVYPAFRYTISLSAS